MQAKCVWQSKIQINSERVREVAIVFWRASVCVEAYKKQKLKVMIRKRERVSEENHDTNSNKKRKKN